jgi:hypothetical protein
MISQVFLEPLFRYETLTQYPYPLEGARMSDYIVCLRKRNNPRMNVRVCQHKCPDKEDCKAYLTCIAAGSETKIGPLASKPQSVEIEAA